MLAIDITSLGIDPPTPGCKIFLIKIIETVTKIAVPEFIPPVKNNCG
jgi:hypothetical protein